MTFENIQALLVEQLGVMAEIIKPTSRLIEDLGADSLDMVEIVMAIEDETSTDIPDAALENLSTVQDFLDFVNL
jgi:acyl carrier protein